MENNRNHIANDRSSIANCFHRKYLDNFRIPPDGHDRVIT